MSMERIATDLIDLIKRDQRRVTVIGDAIVDCWVHGAVEDCQDGCKKLVQTEAVLTPGGAANAMQCLGHWGVRTELYCHAREWQPVKTRFVGPDGSILLRHDNEEMPSKSDGDWSRELALEMVPFSDAVLLSDYDKGYLEPEFITEVVDLCRRRGTPCVADCKRAPEVYDGCVLKANGTWGVRNGIGWKPESDYVETHGEDYPGIWVDGAWVPVKIPSVPPVQCVNHVGAGDCFAAHLALGLAYRLRLQDAVALAHAAGRVYVQHPHNRPPHPAEVAADLATWT